MPQSLGKQPGLDGVRAAAIGAVVLLHVSRDHFPGGFIGVDMFFTLSAFLITTLMLEEIATRQGGFSFRGFYARRALRLGPALLLWIAVIGPIAAIAYGEGHRILASTAIIASYTTDFAMSDGGWGLSGAYGHGWSLAVEEQFYLLWPALLLLLVRRAPAGARRQLLVWAVPIAAAIMVASVAMVGPNVNYFLPWGHGAPLAAGCAAAALRRRGLPQWAGRAVNSGAVAAVLAIGMGALIVAYRDWMYIPVTVGIGLATAVLILHLCGPRDSLATAVFSSRLAQWVGKRSYGYYLFMLTLLGFLPSVVPGGLAMRWNAPMSFIGVTLLVAASYRFVERPCLRIKRRFEPPPAQTATRTLDDDGLAVTSV